MNNQKIIGSILLGVGVGAVVFSLSLDLWREILIILSLVIGVSIFTEGNKNEIKEEILSELNKK